jgi:hypothetical protein
MVHGPTIQVFRQGKIVNQAMRDINLRKYCFSNEIITKACWFFFSVPVFFLKKITFYIYNCLYICSSWREKRNSKRIQDYLRDFHCIILND